MKYLFALLLTFGFLMAQPQQLIISGNDSLWTFTDKQGDSVVFEWCGASTLEPVRSIYVETYLHKELYRAFLDVSDAEEAKMQLSKAWDFRKHIYQTKLESTPPSAYFAIVKKDAKIVGFVIFDVDTPEEVSISPVMILPEAQGMGLGKELVFSILKRFPNLKKISLVTTKEMPASEFYKHLGFQEVENKEKLAQIDDPKLKETVAFFEWNNPDAQIESEGH